jgi:hypothetical protein
VIEERLMNDVSILKCCCIKILDFHSIARKVIRGMSIRYTLINYILKSRPILALEIYKVIE